jgi:outer membrane autotransporter protein
MAATRLHSLPQSLTVPQTRLTADYSGGTAQIFGEIGYNIPYQSVALEPFANLAYANLHLDGFTETGGSAALASTSSYTDVTSSTVGLRASPPLSFGSAHVTLRGMAGWRHAYGDVRPCCISHLPERILLKFLHCRSPDAALLEAGLDVGLTPAATFDLLYQGQIASEVQDHGFRADLTVRF